MYAGSLLGRRTCHWPSASRTRPDCGSAWDLAAGVDLGPTVAVGPGVHRVAEDVVDRGGDRGIATGGHPAPGRHGSAPAAGCRCGAGRARPGGAAEFGELGEDQADHVPRLLVGVEAERAVGRTGVTHGRVAEQLTPFRLVALALEQAAPEDVELRLAHRSLEAEQ